MFGKKSDKVHVVKPTNNLDKYSLTGPGESGLVKALSDDPNAKPADQAFMRRQHYRDSCYSNLPGSNRQIDDGSGVPAAKRIKPLDLNEQNPIINFFSGKPKDSITEKRLRADVKRTKMGGSNN
jgi:hypothetical protein